jgi:TldD protein
MKLIVRGVYISGLVFLSLFSVNAQDSLMNILKKELNREVEGFKNAENPPYFIEYRVDDINSYSLGSSFGSLVRCNYQRGRILNAMIKVGDYELDNTHEIEGNANPMAQLFAIPLPIENKPEAIQQTIWDITNRAYKQAMSTYYTIQNNEKIMNNPDKLSDFSKESPVQYFEPPLSETEIKFDSSEWIKLIKKYSEPFLTDDSIFSGEAVLSFYIDRKYLVNSEGSSIVQNNIYTQLQINGSIKTSGGSILPLYKSYYAYRPESLPSSDSVLRDVHFLIKKLEALKDAPAAEPYSGPAILSPSAAAVFFHEIFGHRVEGQRLRSDIDGQTFKAKVYGRVLPKYMSVVSDPTLSEYNGHDLYGYYKYDDQGVPATKVKIVENGILKNFLMSRTPIRGFENSNGHGRAQPGYIPVARQSNLLVETTKPESMKQLRKRLISECKKEHKQYGYLFDEVTGGYTMTNRYTPNVFNVTPTVVYRIYTDGRPDELVRGVNFIGTPLSIFAEIAATGDLTKIFTGFCTAESGSIPVTAISPALYIKVIETQKQPENYGQFPILPRPGSENFNRNEKNIE